MSGATVYTWSNFGKVAVGEEVAGGGPEDPVADLAVVGTGIIFLGGALWRQRTRIRSASAANATRSSA